MGAMVISTYVISDIHGEYDKFIELLDKIKLKETDILYVLGDILVHRIIINQHKIPHLI